MDDDIKNNSMHYEHGGSSKEQYEMDVRGLPTQESSEQEDNTLEKEWRFDFKIFMAILVLLIGYQGAFFLLTLTSPIISYINADLGPVNYASWIAISYSMSNGIMIAVSGRMMDIWGRRYIMLAGHVLGAIGCVVGGTAKSVGVVIAGVAIGGIGAGIQQQTTACIAELFPRKWRPLGATSVSVSVILSGVFGTPIAYTLVEHLSWRWAFWVTLMADGAATVGTALFYFPPTFDQKHRSDGITKWKQFRNFDWIGLTIFIGSLLSLLLGISFGGSRYPWKSANIIVPIVVGVLGLIGLGFWTVSRFVVDPLIPPPLMKDVRGFVVVLATVFVAGMLLYSLIAFWPEQVQTMYTTDLNLIGWEGMTVLTGTVVGALILGPLMKYVAKWTKAIFVGSVVVMTALVGAMAAMTPETNGAAIALSLLGSIAIGFVQLMGISMIITRVSDEYIGIAVGLSGTMRLIGGSLATAIYGSVLGNKVAEVLPVNVADAVLPLGFDVRNLAGLIEYLTGASTAKVPGLTPQILAAAEHAIKVSYGQGFRLIYLVSIAFGGLALISVSFTKSLDDAMTDEVNVELNANTVTKAAHTDHHHDNV